jgi:hypothetical protein
MKNKIFLEEFQFSCVIQYPQYSKWWEKNYKNKNINLFNKILID